MIMMMVMMTTTMMMMIMTQVKRYKFKYRKYDITSEKISFH